MLLTSILHAQVASYGFSQGSGTYTPLIGGTVIASYTSAATSLGRMDDQIYNLAAATIPFTFTFDGVGYTGLNVSSNGFITFGATAPATTNYVPMSSANLYAGAISAFGRDIEGGFVLTADRTAASTTLLNASNLGLAQVGDFIDGTGIPAGTTIAAISGSTITLSAAATTTGIAGIYRIGGPLSNIQYGIEGSAPNRVFVIQYSNFKRYGAILTEVQHMSLNFQIRLNETSNNITIVYNNCSPGLTTLATVNQVGLRGANNTFATNVNNRLNVKGTSDWASSTAGTANTSGQLFNNVAPANVIPNGLTYTWTPPVPCTGTPVGGIVTPASLNLCSGSAVGNLVGSGFTPGVTGLAFQWEEFVGGLWGNATGGTGATTATYTPPVYSGTPIQYRLKVTCTGSGLFDFSSPVLIGNPISPTTQVTNVTSNPLLTSATINWTNGNGNRRFVVLSDTPTFTDPTNGSGPALVANTVYSGTGQQIIFDGITATVSVTGLLQATNYYIKVYEYVRCGAGPYDYFYNVSSGTNVATMTTASPITNDDCGGAITLTVGTVFATNPLVASNIGATASEVGDPTIPAPGCSIYSGGDVWYKVQVPISGNLTIETNPKVGSLLLDTGLAVYSGACGTLALVACDDDASTNGFFSLISLTGRTPNETLYIRLFEYQNNLFDTFLVSAYDCPSTTPAPTGAAAQTFCDTPAPTVANLVATGTGIKWYDAATLGTLLPPTTPLVSGNVYYASQTLTCEGLSRLAVTATLVTVPAIPTGAATQTFCNTTLPAPTLASLTVTGTGLIWYDAAVNGNVLPSTTVLTATTYYVASNNGSCDGPRLAITTSVSCPIVGCLSGFLFPTATFTPTTCDGSTVNTISAFSWAGDRVNVNVTLGQTYTFRSSVATDFLTISADNGLTAAAAGTTPLTWVSTVTGVIRFHINTNAACGTQNTSRTTSIVCGIQSTDTPDYVNLQFPFTATTQAGTNVTIYGQVYEAGLTDVAPNLVGQAPGINAWVGYSTTNTNPNTWTDWVPATWNAGHVSNNDEYQAGLGGTLAPGTYYYATRFTLNNGPYVYGGVNNIWNAVSAISGVLTVTPIPNDLCPGAVALTTGGVFTDYPLTGTLLGASTGTLIPSCQTSYNSDVWYTVTVPASGNITIETQVTPTNTLTDTVVAVYSGTCSTTLTQVGCDDDGGPVGPNGLMSLLPLTGQTPLSTLYVVVSKFGTVLPTATSNGFIISAYDSSLSNSSFDSANFVAYPNPVKDVLNISFIRNIDQVQVINLLGQEVMTKSINANEGQIDMSNLPVGTYLVRVTSENQIKTLKIIKE